MPLHAVTIYGLLRRSSLCQAARLWRAAETSSAQPALAGSLVDRFSGLFLFHPCAFLPLLGEPLVFSVVIVFWRAVCQGH